MAKIMLKILKIPSIEEVKQAVWDLHPLKSFRSNGFPRIFYKTYWNIVGLQTTEFVKECLKKQRMPSSMNETFLVLILKVKQPFTVNHYRPISLCNFTYKIISRTLSNRLSPLVNKFISPNQGAFIRGCWIAKQLCWHKN